jgi:hypothetical protein
VALPLDTVKSVVQVSYGSTSIVKAVLRLIREEGGAPRLFRGWQAAFGRAIPGSAATLATFDLVKVRALGC